MQLDYYRFVTLDRPSQSIDKTTTSVAQESTERPSSAVQVTASTTVSRSDTSTIPSLLPSSPSELDALLDRMLEIQSGSSASFTMPSDSSIHTQPSIPSRDSTGLVESLLGEERPWTEPSSHSGIFLPAYYTGQQMGLYPNPLEHPISYYSGSRAEYAQQGYLHQPPPLQSYGYTMYGIPSLHNSKFRQRHPFERAISSPEFYTPRQFYGEIKKLGSGQSQSLPTFEGSISDLDQPVTSITSSPETSSPLSKSPLGYSMETSLFSYCSSPSLPGPSGLQLQKVRKSSPSLFTCAVCGDVAQCLHYGVRTCEGCKGFFKRSVQKKSKYVCLGNKDCVIDKRRRNRCQYCRYQKCLSVGMVKEVVRTDSLKGRRGRLPSKSKSSDETSTSGSQSLTKALLNAFTSGTETQQRQMFPRSSAVVVSNPVHLVDSISSSINAIHRWADRLPVWARIVQSDRNKLTQNACVSILSFRIAFLSVNNVSDGQLVFDDGMVYSIKSCDEFWKPWLTLIAELSLQIKALFGEDLTGYCCLKALLLFMSENVNLEKVEECDKIKNNIINCLKEHCTYSVETKTKPTQYFSAILAMVNDVYSVGKKAKESYLACTRKPLQMPPLLVDAFGV